MSTRKWQQWVGHGMVVARIFYDGYRQTAGLVLREAILDETPADPAGSGTQSKGIMFGVGRAILGGVGRR